jgi:hypothetical protein
VHGDREIFFGMFLSDYVQVEVFFYIPGFGHFPEVDGGAGESPAVLLNDIVAQVDALGTNEDAVGPFDEGIGVSGRAAAEAANGLVSFVARFFCHFFFLIPGQIRVYHLYIFYFGKGGKAN